MSERPRDFEERARYGAVPFHHLSWLVFWMGDEISDCSLALVDKYV